MPWKPPEIETERLLLRPVELEDKEALFLYAKVPEVSEYTLWEPHESVQDSLNFIENYVGAFYKRGVPEPFGIPFYKTM